MAKKNIYRNVRHRSISILLWAIFALITIDVLNKFNLVNFTAFNSGILTLTGALFLLAEVGWFMGRKQGKKKKDVLSMFIMLVAVLALIGALTGFFGFSISILEPIQGIVSAALAILVVVEIFRK